jgi:hypothetical protein
LRVTGSPAGIRGPRGKTTAPYPRCCARRSLRDNEKGRDVVYIPIGLVLLILLIILLIYLL